MEDALNIVALSCPPGVDCAEKFPPESSNSSGIVASFVEIFLTILEKSMEQIPRQLISKLQESMTAMESTFLDAMRPKFDLLGLTDQGNPSNFQEVLVTANTAAEGTIRRKLTTLQEEIQSVVRDRIHHSVNQLIHKIQKMHDAKAASVLLGYKNCLEKALEVYILILRSVVSFDQVVAKETLEKVHSSAATVAQILLSEKISLKPSEEEREFLVNTLNASLLREFSAMKQSNENTLNLTLSLIQEKETDMLNAFKLRIYDALNHGKELGDRNLTRVLRDSLKLLKEFAMDTSMSADTLKRFPAFLSELEDCIDDALERFPAVNHNNEDTPQNPLDVALKSIQREAEEYFYKGVKSFISKFDILHKDQFNVKAEELQNSFRGNIMANPNLSPECVAELLAKLKEALQGLQEKIWTDTLIEKNRNGEERIIEEMLSLKKAFQIQIVTMNDPETVLNSTIATFQRSFLCSSTDNQLQYVQKLREDLEVILNETQAQTRNIEVISERLIKEFKDLARKHEYIHELYSEQLQKFFQISQNISDSQKAKFALGLGDVLQNVLRQRHNQVHCRKMRRFVDSLIEKFLMGLHRKGTSHLEGLKTEFKKQVELEAKHHHVDSTEFLQRLDEAMEISLREYKNQMTQQFEEVIPLILTTYKEEMRKHFQYPKYVSPEILTALHEKAGKVALSRVSKKSKCDEVMELLKNELKEAFEEFVSINAMNAKTSFAIGIHLGTTNSCVAVYKKNLEIIPNSLGDLLTPCYVHFDRDEERIGDTAILLANNFPELTVFNMKRFIGRNFDDPSLQSDLSKKRWPFVVTNEQGLLRIQVHNKKYSPEDVSAVVLKNLKEGAQNYLKQNVKAAVLTVPAYFTEKQISATKKAGEAAGLEILDIIAEPVAAAIACELHWKYDQGVLTALVYHLGGETFSASIVAASKGFVNVVAVREDLNIGGEHFDNELMKYCANELMNVTGVNLLAEQDSKDPTRRETVRKALIRLKNACVDCKIHLGDALFATVACDSILDGHNLKVEISRNCFEDMISHYLDKTIVTVEELLRESKLTIDDIKEVLLVGGSTKIPFVEEKLMDFFNEWATEFNRKFEPDQVVAMGAACEAAILNGKRSQEKRKHSSATSSESTKRLKKSV